MSVHFTLLASLFFLRGGVLGAGGGSAAWPPPQELTVSNGGAWGAWGEPEFCPPGSYATGFQLKVEPPLGVFRDDTALNAVRLLCGGSAEATSSEGLWGEWTPPQHCGGSGRLVGFRLLVEPPRGGLGDDTAANSLDGVCSNGGVLSGGGGTRGVWGNWSTPCAPPRAVCGLRSRVEAPQRTRDDTGLNDVILYCCA